MDGTVNILSLEVISRQIEILNCERTLVGFAVGAQGIGLDLVEITDQGDELPAVASPIPALGRAGTARA